MNKKKSIAEYLDETGLSSLKGILDSDDLDRILANIKLPTEESVKREMAEKRLAGGRTSDSDEMDRFLDEINLPSVDKIRSMYGGRGGRGYVVKKEVSISPLEEDDENLSARTGALRSLIRRSSYGANRISGTADDSI